MVAPAGSVPEDSRFVQILIVCGKKARTYGTVVTAYGIDRTDLRQFLQPVDIPFHENVPPEESLPVAGAFLLREVQQYGNEEEYTAKDTQRISCEAAENVFGIGLGDNAVNGAEENAEN